MSNDALVSKCKECGCIIYATTDVIRALNEEGAEIIGLLRDGYKFEFMPIEEARSLFGCNCGEKYGAA